MDPRQLFLEMMQDLRRTVAEPSSYGLLKAAGAMRLLLLDGLLGKVNRETKVKIRYSVKISFPENAPADPYAEFVTLDVALDGLYPPHNRPGALVELRDLDGFLALRVGKIGKSFFTVRDVISAAANISGGVHLGDPRPRDSAGVHALASSRPYIRVGGAQIDIFQMRGIVNVVIDAMQPLEAALRGHTQAE
jgi:hypothetical protein